MRNPSVVGTLFVSLVTLGGCGGPEGAGSTEQEPLATSTNALVLPVASSAVQPAGSSPEFVLLARNAVAVRERATVSGGDIGVQESQGHYLVGHSALTVEERAQAAVGHRVLASSVWLERSSSVGDVFTSHLVNHGGTHGTVSPFQQPPVLPAASVATPGTADLKVGHSATLSICPGAYHRVNLKHGAILQLAAGVYDFASLRLHEGSHLEALGPVQIRIAGRLFASERTYVGPAPGVSFSARDVRVQVFGVFQGRHGEDGDGEEEHGHGHPNERLPDAVFGPQGVIRVLMLVPNGTLVLGHETQATGAFAAVGIDVHAKAEVTFEDGFQSWSQPLPPPCDDGNVCTIDTCSAGVCQHTPASTGSSCSDGNGCNGQETCDSHGACAPGAPPTVDDGNPCTADSCDPILGVVHTAVVAGTSCSDGNVCNGEEVCDGASTCQPGTAPTVDDGNPCTADSCDPLFGVVHLPVSTGTSCADSNACNGVEICNGAGSCLAGLPPVTDDGNPCTADSCNPALGVVHAPVPSGTTCSDSNVCNGAEICNSAGVCVAGPPLSLDDGNACTADSCDPSSGVVHTLIAGCSVLPPDPATVAPPTDPTVETDIASATAFLYTGSNPIQTGVEEGTIEARRVAIIRGQVKARDGNPLSGVQLTILGHPEFGQTLTRADGLFDLAVNGGGLLTVNYQKDGYLPAQRQVPTPWRDYVWAEEVVLVQYDSWVSAVALGASITQIARGSPVTDEDGTRQATLLIPPGTQASMKMADGTTQPLAAMHVRATEYTVGPEGPKAMPALLPPTSAYTYAVELSVDEAVMAGATRVQFDQPVAFYVENFLGFPVGGLVPTGYYDRIQGIWVPSDNGKVVKIVSITNGSADLDTDGNGVADNLTTLAALGVTENERAMLAATYSAGASLWRVPVTHFSPYDMNWPYGCEREQDCTPPKQSPPDSNPTPCPTESPGSLIECENQVLGEELPVVGTPWKMHYRSSRVNGHTDNRTIQVNLTPSDRSPAAGLVIVEIIVAGKQVRWQFPPSAGLSMTYVWDGFDAYGRPVTGHTKAKVLIGYQYTVVYLTPDEYAARSFLRLSRDGVPMTVAGSARLAPVIMWQVFKDVWLDNMSVQGKGLGGWTVSEQHSYHPESKVLDLGDGTRRDSGSLPTVVENFAGGGPASATDGVPALQGGLDHAWSVATAPDGSLYICTGATIQKVDPDGILSTVIGRGTTEGEGIPAAQVGPLSYCSIGLTVGGDGSVYFSEVLRGRVRRISPEGLVTTVAGTGIRGFSGDEGPATQAQLNVPGGVAVSADGSLYIADQYNSRVRKVDPSGIIATIASLSWVSSVAVGPDGSVFAASTGRISRIWPDGRMETVAGNGNQGGGLVEGSRGPEAYIGNPRDLAMSPTGKVFFTTTQLGSGEFVRELDEQGLVWTIAGSGSGPVAVNDGVPALQANIRPTGVAVGPDGVLYFGYYNSAYEGGLRGFVARVRSPMPGLAVGESMVSSSDGLSLYVFDERRRHLRTLDTRSAVVQNQFGYDGNGLLAWIQDVDGNQTTFERDAQGSLSAIVAPRGQRTLVSLDSTGMLSQVTNPAGESVHLSYDNGGLLKTLTDPKGQVHDFDYDPRGRLIRDVNPAGGMKQLSRTNTANGFVVKIETALARLKTYLVEKLSTGERRRQVTNPDGTMTTSVQAQSGVSTTTNADGSVVSNVLGPDPRFGLDAPVSSSTTRTPSGTTLWVTESRTATLADPQNPLSATVLGETMAVNGRAYRSTYTAATRTTISRTPAGRTTTTVLDAKGKLSQLQPPGVLPMAFSYTPTGQLQTVVQGTRSYTIGYNAQGYPQTLTDPLSRTVSFTYDPAGRVQTQTLPGSRTVGFGYDRSGNLTSLMPPGHPAHGFGYTPIDLTASYTPPGASNTGLLSTSYSYDLDGALAQVLLPDQGTIVPGYDTAGRLTSVTTARGMTTLGYDTAGRVATVAAPGSEELTYTYDGFLKTSETSTGTIAGMVSWSYDNDFRVATASVNGSAVAYQYDADSLLTAAGALSITREAATGRISGTTLGAVATSQSYSQYGELGGLSTSVSGSSAYSYTLSRDLAGRITGKTETVQGTTDTYAYGYDEAGRLATVQKNGQQIASYVYDQNGNRLQKSTGAGTEVGSYDDQDRMYGYGAASYAYRPNGELATKTVTGQVTSYDYDAFGNLRGVTLPSGTAIEYVIDGQNRRVGKKVNGVLVEGFLYQGQLRPVAWLDDTGTVKARFVYGTRVNVPEYMVTGSNTYRIVTDHLGSPRLVIDTVSGQVAQRMDYDEWGQVLADSNPGFQPFGFAGGLWDRDTGFVRFGARDYDAAIGRWVNKDPVRFNGGTTNLYEYVGSDPVNFVDPWGLKCRTYWQRVGDNFMLTNKTIPGLLAPMGLTAVVSWLSGGGVATAIGGITPGAWAMSGFGGATLGGTTFTAAEAGVIAGATGLTNWGLVSLAFEAGVGVGSLIEAAFEGGGCDNKCGG